VKPKGISFISRLAYSNHRIQTAQAIGIGGDIDSSGHKCINHFQGMRTDFVPSFHVL
jgi:hypothetical protein